MIRLSSYLHCDEAVIHQHLLCQKVSTNGGFVAGAELLVDLIVVMRSASQLCAIAALGRLTYWFMSDVFPTPLSPKIMT